MNRWWLHGAGLDDEAVLVGLARDDGFGTSARITNEVHGLDAVELAALAVDVRV
jgi:hypothetical protein